MLINNATAVLIVAHLEDLARQSENPEYSLEIVNGLCAYMTTYEPTLAGLSAGKLEERTYWTDGPDGQDTVYVNEQINRVLNNYEVARRGPNCVAPPRPVTPHSDHPDAMFELADLFNEIEQDAASA